MQKKVMMMLALLMLASVSAKADEKYDFVVAADGSGDFTTVQAAVNAVPDYRKVYATTILVKKGIYKEKVVIAESKNSVRLIGEDGAVISYGDWAQKPNRFGENTGTSGSSSIYIFGPDFYAENITFENTAGPVGQAVACFVSGDRSVFRRCRFLGFQDTLYTFGENTRQYYEDCYIEGTVDFIFGKATAYFLRCHLHSVGDGYLTAPATPEGHAYGYVFQNCKMTAADGVTKVWLSRPWRPYAQAVFIHCDLGQHIVAEGWNNWGNEKNESTAYYAEYDNFGAGADLSGRASWGHVLEDAARYEAAKVLAGTDGWNPQK